MNPDRPLREGTILIPELHESFLHRSQGLAIGLNSGTSADGIDAVLIQVNDGAVSWTPRVSLLGYYHEPFSDEERGALHRLNESSSPISVVGLWHARLGIRFGHAACRLLEKTNVLPKDV